MLPLDRIADFSAGSGVASFAAGFAQTSMGTAGLVVLPVLVALSAAGAANGSMFSSARVVFMSARQGDMPACLAQLWGSKHPTPVRAIVFQSLISAVMLVPGNFDTLLNAFSVAAVRMFHGLAH